MMLDELMMWAPCVVALCLAIQGVTMIFLAAGVIR